MITMTTYWLYKGRITLQEIIENPAAFITIGHDFCSVATHST
jgi:hypothetical protein